MQKRVDGVVAESYLYGQGLLPLAQLDGSGNVASVFGPGFMEQGGQTYAVLTDHLGSPRMVVNAATGAVVQRMEYDEFGRVLLDSITPDITGYKPLPFGFAGGLYDRDTNLVRFGARDYDPVVGRWTTKDPILFAGGDGNLYGYCFDDPINLTDPNGCIAPALLGAWAAGEAGLSIWDWWDAAKTVLDPCKSWKEKGGAIGFAAAGMVGPGGGYGRLAKVLQTGGHTITNRTAKAFGKSKGVIKKAIEKMKKAHGLPNDYHTKIRADGSVWDANTDEYIDNFLDYE